MSTTQLFVEQIFIGFMVLLIAALPHHPELLGQIDQLQGWQISGSIAIATVGTAYLLGILFDRFADTLVDDLIRHQRLRFALRDGLPHPWMDPFPEGRHRMRVLRAGGSVVEYADYLRSRIRLSRALAVYLPGLTFAAVLALARDVGISLAPLASGFGIGGGHALGSDRALAYWQLVVPAVYLSAAWLNWTNDACDQGLPKTHQRSKVERYARTRGFWQVVSRGRQRHALTIDLLRNPTIALLGLLALGAVLVAHVSGRPLAPWLAYGGLLLTVLAAWTWWRISDTFFQFLADFDQEASRPTADRVAG